MGSKGHDIVEDLLIHLLTSSSVTDLKVLKAAGTESGVSFKEPEVENVSLILLILLVKKEANMSARLFSELSASRTVSEVRCSTFLNDCHSFLGSLLFAVIRLV